MILNSKYLLHSKSGIISEMVRLETLIIGLASRNNEC